MVLMNTNKFWLTDVTQVSTMTLGQSGPGSYGNEEVLYNPHHQMSLYVCN